MFTNLIDKLKFFYILSIIIGYLVAFFVRKDIKRHYYTKQKIMNI